MTLRRSSRITATSLVTKDTGLLDDDSTYTEQTYIFREEEELELVKPKRKRQKSDKKKATKSDDPTFGLFKNVRGRRGALKNIVEMPLDILHEIFMYLNPIELMHLSRMSKALRSILMTKTAAFIWKQARFNLDGFPDCPEDLNEAQYISLTFGAICDYCKQRKGRYFMWSIRKCSCRTCLTSVDMFQSIRKYQIPREFDHLYYLLPSIDMEAGNEPTDPQKLQTLLCVASATQLIDSYAGMNHGERATWLVQARRERVHRIQHGRRCEAWFKVEHDKHSFDLDCARHRRRKAIRKKLKELGWGEELKNVTDFGHWKLVNQPKDLTDRIWQNIRNELIADLQSIKDRRLELEYYSTLSHRNAY